MPPATRTTRENVAREVESAGRARTKAVLGAAASLSPSCQVPGIGTSPPLPLTPSSPSPVATSPCLGQRPHLRAAPPCPGWRGLQRPEPSPRAPSPPRYSDSSTSPFALFIMQVPARAGLSRWEKAFGINGAICLLLFFFFKYLNRFAQPSNFEAEHADARTQPPAGVRPGVGVRSGRAGLKSAGWPANSWMTGAPGLFFFRIWATESPCVPPTPHPTHTYTPHTSGCQCARLKKSQQRDPPKIGEGTSPPH